MSFKSPWRSMKAPVILATEWYLEHTDTQTEGRGGVGVGVEGEGERECGYVRTRV